MPHGHIARVEPQLGFGWIVDDAGLEWFFVAAGVQGDTIEYLRRDDRVSFSPEWTDKGPRAAEIRPVHPLVRP